ncbi:DNA repair protein RecO [Brassicibacter mesophilus]|uniref:DNA repair protein RecO n=1 Tax=Brassicibacter mesophilus TaxID=745119 RepID=UPI003D20F579
MFVTTEGLVLRQTKYDESDKILTIFTKKNGKIQAIAKGARSPKSSLVASTQVFCYSNFLLYQGKNFYHINQGEVLNSYYGLREDLHKLAYATYMIELIDAGISEEESNEKLFEMLVKALKVLSDTKQGYKKLTLAFKLKYISFIGYRPHLGSCVLCGGQTNNNIKFSTTHGGIVCEKCLKNDLYGDTINRNTLLKLEELLYTPLNDINEVKLADDEINKIEKILMKYVFSRIEKRNFKSLEFIHALEK